MKAKREAEKCGAKGSVAILKESERLGCASQDSYPRNVFYVSLECWNRNTPSNAPKAPGTKSKCGKERVLRAVLFHKWAPHERSLFGPKFEENFAPERCARQAAWDLAKDFTMSRIRKKLRFLFLVKTYACRDLVLQRDQKSENSYSISEHQCT